MYSYWTAPPPPPPHLPHTHMDRVTTGRQQPDTSEVSMHAYMADRCIHLSVWVWVWVWVWVCVCVCVCVCVWVCADVRTFIWWELNVSLPTHTLTMIRLCTNSLDAIHCTSAVLVSNVMPCEWIVAMNYPTTRQSCLCKS